MRTTTLLLIIFLFHSILIPYTNQAQPEPNVRERIKLNDTWRFALGHATDASLDYYHGTGYFSYLAKTGYGDGPADKNFDDHPWRIINIPHDWCVELPFAANGSHSHGYKSIGRNYPENSVGWYRKHFTIPEDDLGKRISLEFDGVYRNSSVWVNGFYLGTQQSGYNSFAYDITEYLNYGGENIVAVRVDVTMEEGWYYEGAGIVRSVWLLKTSPLHVARYGTFITTELEDGDTDIKIRTTITNDSRQTMFFDLQEIILNKTGEIITSEYKERLELLPGDEKTYYSLYRIDDPDLWSIEKPFLHTLVTEIMQDGKPTDEYRTNFGIRTVRFYPDSGFFLNGQPVKIKGTNLHQDHAGVGRAIPPALHEYRIRVLKSMGSNAVRTSHDPPDPAFLDACDRLGFLVLDENRLMGVNDMHLNLLENLIKRDRNHPSVVLWSLGNEEWAIEGNETGARIASSMQAFAQRLDSSRAFTAACSGGWDNGIGKVVEVMGYNYFRQGNIDEHHKLFPWQSDIGTEESNARGTRGVYETQSDACHLAYINDGVLNLNAETGWKFYDERPFLSGLFIWTGIDYRGEPTPYKWPAVTSQCGISDLCAFPKDIFYYFKSWWGEEPILHLYPHWNWPEKTGDTIPVIVYSNCDEVELLLNGKSLGKKNVPVNGHLQWNVIYKAGKLEARGFQNGKLIQTALQETTGKPAAIHLESNKTILKADNEDVSVITVSILDNKGHIHPTANEELTFVIEGPGRIIGVGNGDPSSHEPDQYFNLIKTFQIKYLKELPVENLENCPETAKGYDDTGWKTAFDRNGREWYEYVDTLIVVRGTFELSELAEGVKATLFSKSVMENQSLYVNGKLIASGIKRNSPDQVFTLDVANLNEGINEYAITGQRFRLTHQWDEPNTDPGVVQVIFPADAWKRKAFNGLAEVIIQSTGEAGEIKLKAISDNLGEAEISIKTVL